MKPGGKTVMTLNRRGQLVPKPADQLKMDGVTVPLKDIRTGIAEARKAAKDKCSPGKPMPKALDAMSRQCKRAFVKELYAGPITGKTIFRGRAKALSASYLALVKVVLSSVPGAKAAPTPPVRPVRPARPVAPVAPVRPKATNPETDATLKKAMREVAYDAIVNDHCGSESATGSTAVGGGKTCKDMGGDEAPAVYKALKTIKLSELKTELKDMIVAKFKKAIADDADLKAKYGSKDADALATKMWKAAGFGTEEPKAVKPVKPVKPTKCDDGEMLKDGKCVKKPGETGERGKFALRIGAGIGVGSFNIRTSKPAGDNDDKINVSLPLSLGLDLFLGYRVSPSIEVGGRVKLAYSLTGQREVGMSYIDPSHFVAFAAGIEGNLRVFKKGSTEILIGASVVAGLLHGTNLLLGTLGDGVDVTAPTMGGGVHGIYRSGGFYLKLSFDGEGVISAGTTRDSAFFPTSTEMRGQTPGSSVRGMLTAGFTL